jgi:GNAT superfamily N-acetyltransferase
MSSSSLSFSVRSFRSSDIASIESLYRAHKTALFQHRVALLQRRVLARPLLTAVYVSLALVLSSQLIIYLTPGQHALSLPLALSFAVMLHALLFVALALYVAYRHRVDTDTAVSLDLGLRLQRYANASVHWHMLFVAELNNDKDNSASASRIVGWLGATFSPTHNAIQIDTLGVDVAHRRRGVARALLLACQRAATERAVRRIDVILRAPLSSPSLSALLCADDAAPDANVEDLRARRGDDFSTDLPAASLFRSVGFRPSKRLEPNQTDVDAFELWRKVLIADDGATAEKPKVD